MQTPTAGAKRPERLDDARRIDLRTTPAVRAHHGQGPTAMLLEVLSLGRVEARDGALVLEIALPDLGL